MKVDRNENNWNRNENYKKNRFHQTQLIFSWYQLTSAEYQLLCVKHCYFAFSSPDSFFLFVFLSRQFHVSLIIIVSVYSLMLQPIYELRQWSAHAGKQTNKWQSDTLQTHSMKRKQTHKHLKTQKHEHITIAKQQNA